jgi:hypothetical protein
MKKLWNWFFSLFNSKPKLKKETRIISGEVIGIINSINDIDNEANNQNNK